MKISAVMVCFNAERTIRKALDSLDWADEIVVVDSFSDDSTPDICAEYDVLFHQREWKGYVDQKNYALEKASNSWVFAIDSDEEVSPQLRSSVEALRAKNSPEYAGYRCPRLVFYLGRWIKHGSWYPDFKVRLFDRTRVRWSGKELHERIDIEGKTGTLKGNLYHYTYKDIHDHIRKLNGYTTIAAEELVREGKNVNILNGLLRSAWRFLRSYIFKLGFLDGYPGLVIAMMEQQYALTKYMKAVALKKSIDD